MASLNMIPAAAKRLQGKVAIVTGGASGIGECAARLFSKHGAKVIIADIQDDRGHAVCNDLDPDSTTYVHCDVTNETNVKSTVDIAVAKYGKLDIMYNNAGIAGDAKFNILDNEKTDFEKVISVNLIGTFLGTKHAARVMIPFKKGSIISTASACSAISGAVPHAYTSSKHGLVGLTRNAAVELGRHGIRVNCVSPYIVMTPLGMDYLKLNEERASGIYSNLKGAILKPEDIAEAALYLASDDSQYVSGHNLIVDGGFTIMNSSFCMFEQ